jgi:hypothetical protein
MKAYGERAPGTHWIEGLVNPRVGLEKELLTFPNYRTLITTSGNLYANIDLYSKSTTISLTFRNNRIDSEYE